MDRRNKLKEAKKERSSEGKKKKKKKSDPQVSINLKYCPVAI